MLLQRALRLGFVRRSMATGHGHGHNTEYNGIKLTPIQEIGAFTAIFCGVLGPGILLMLFRDRPLAEH